MASIFPIKQGDTDTAILFIEDAFGNPVNLTEFSATEHHVCRARRSGEDMAFEVLAVVHDAATGEVWVPLSSVETDSAGELEAVLVLFRADHTTRSFPTEGFYTISVQDTIEATIAQSPVILDQTTAVTYGTGQWAWTPVVRNVSQALVSNAEVRVIDSLGTTIGPATTSASGTCLANDGLGAFRLNAGVYTLTITITGVTTTRKLTIDATGNEVIS